MSQSSEATKSWYKKDLEQLTVSSNNVEMYTLVRNFTATVDGHLKKQSTYASEINVRKNHVLKKSIMGW